MRPFANFPRGVRVAVFILPMAVGKSPAALAKHSRLVSAVILFFAFLILTGCGGTTSSGSFTASPAGGSTPPPPAGSTATAVSAVSAPSTTIASGSTSSASVTLNAAAPTGGAQVSLTSSNTAAASVPASVSVAAGQTVANFTVTTGTVSADTSVQITAAYNNTLAGFNVMVRAAAAPPPPPPAGSGVALTLSPTSVTLVAGAKQQFTATVSGSANTGVSWTVSGGAIAYTGFFTAPSVTSTTTMTVTATSQADPAVSKTAQVTVTPVPPPSGTGYSGTGPVASWKAYQYKDTDGLYHQAIKITGATTPYPVIGYSYSRADCTNLGDKFNDFWQPLGNGLWWFINRAELVYVKWVWYDNAQNKNILQQTPCIDYSSAPKYN